MDLRRYLLPPVVFTVAGPGIGILTALICHPSGSPDSIGLGVILIYMFAWIPALVSGCLYVALWPLFSRLRTLGIYGVGCVTGLATVAPLLVYRALSLHSSNGMLFYLICAIPAALCGMLAARTRAGASRG